MQYVNQSYEDQTGYSSDRLIGFRMSEVFGTHECGSKVNLLWCVCWQCVVLDGCQIQVLSTYMQGRELEGEREWIKGESGREGVWVERERSC